MQPFKERVKQSFIAYDSYLFVMHRFWLVAWILKGRPVPPPAFVKQQCVLAYQRLFGLRTLIETGTYLGEMVRATRSVFDEIYSIELGEELYRRARRRFDCFPHIHLIHGDSAAVLRNLLPSVPGPCLFWLDAHFSGAGTVRGVSETPIMAELKCILSHPSKMHVVLIDDARCFTGRNDYPSLDELEKYLLEHWPGSRLNVAEDIIRITPPDGSHTKPRL